MLDPETFPAEFEPLRLHARYAGVLSRGTCGAGHASTYYIVSLAATLKRHRPLTVVRLGLIFC